MERSRLKTVLVAAGVAIALLATVSVALGSMTDDADAARKTQLKTLWAVVSFDGTLERGRGVTSVSKPDTGEYTIKFRQDVSRCAYSATLRNSGFIYLTTSREDPLTRREVAVNTLDRGGFVRDTSFHLVVNC